MSDTDKWYISGPLGIGTAQPKSKLSVAGENSTVDIETRDIIHLLRPGVNGVKNDNSAALSVGSFETGISGATRLDIKLSGGPDNSNGWGLTPDKTVMSLQANGHVGIGTTTPGKKLHIQGSSSAPLLNDGHDRPGLAITGSYPELDLFSAADNPNHGPTIRMGGYDDDTKKTFKHWVIGTAGRKSTFLDIGFSDKSDPNPHAGIRNHNGKTCLTILESGNVGIGTQTPAAKLQFDNGGGNKVVVYDNGPTDRYGFGLNSGNLNAFVPAGGRFSIRQNGYDGTEVMTVTGVGNVGIGTQTPAAKLQFDNGGGNKVVVYDNGTNRYGFGLNNGNLNAFVPAEGRFSIRQNGYDGTEVMTVTGVGNVGIGRMAGMTSKLHVAGNGGVLSLEGTDHAYIQWYPDGLSAGRKAWVGFGGPNDDSLTIRNEIPGGRMHIFGDELLYLLNKQGVIISKAWEGNGNLLVEGALMTLPISTDLAKQILDGKDNGTAILGAANGINEPRIDFYFKWRDRVYQASILGKLA